MLSFFRRLLLRVGPGVPHWLLVGILEFQYLFMASAWKVDCSVSWIVSLAGYRVGMFAVRRIVPSMSGRLSILRLFLPDSVSCWMSPSLSFLLPLPSLPWVVCPCSAPIVLPSVIPFLSKLTVLGVFCSHWLAHVCWLDSPWGFRMVSFPGLVGSGVLVLP